MSKKHKRQKNKKKKSLDESIIDRPRIFTFVAVDARPHLNCKEFAFSKVTTFFSPLRLVFVFLHTHKKNVSTFISFLVIWEQFCLEHRLFYILYCKMAAAGYGVVVFLLYSGNYLTFLFIFSSTLGRILLPYFQKIKRGKYIGRLGPKKKD
jgi:hypothetical protein